MYLTAIQPTTHDLHDTAINTYKHQPGMADPSRNEDDGQKSTQRPTPSPNKIDHDGDRSTPPFTKRSSMRPIQGPYSPSPLVLGSRTMLPDYANDTKISAPMSAIEADKSSSFSEFKNGPVSAAPGRGAKFAGRQGWSFKGHPSVIDDTINSDWDVADEMSRLQVSDSRENNATKHDLPQDHQHSVPHSGDSTSSISPTAQTNEPGDSTLFSYSHSRSPSSATTSSDGPASVLTPLHQSKSSMDPKGTLQDDTDRAYSMSSMEKPPFSSHQFTGHQDRPSTQHPVPQYPQNVHAHMAVGPAPSMLTGISVISRRD
ncbi:hypothetical protein RSAG8_00056, partial [Rhizoctonia solani AG-8 WAC10335]